MGVGLQLGTCGVEGKDMSGLRKSNIWAGCIILGVALGFILSQFWGYGGGMPVGVLRGVGAAFLLTSVKRD